MNTELKSRYAWLRSGLAALFTGLILLAFADASRAAAIYRTATGQFGGVVSGNAGGTVSIRGFLGHAYRNSSLMPVADTVTVFADGRKIGTMYTDRTAISGVDYVGIGSLSYTIPRTARRGSSIRLEFYYPGRSWYAGSRGPGAINVVR